jgi:hypothetical protein
VLRWLIKNISVSTRQWGRSYSDAIGSSSDDAAPQMYYLDLGYQQRRNRHPI